MAAYGDTLCFFSELMRRIEYLEMHAKPVAGYTPRKSLGYIKGVFQNVKRGDLDREDETLSETAVPTVWTRTKLIVGNYLHFEDVDYRIVKPYPWKYEGNFYCYELETVTASKDTQTPMPDVNIGGGYY